MIKRIFSLMLVFSLLMSPMLFSAFAVAGTDGSVTAIASQTSVKAGDEFTVVIALDKVSETVVGAIDFTVVLSDGIEYVSHTLGDLDAYMLKSYTSSNGIFTASMTNTGTNSDITILTLTLRAKSTDLGANSVAFSNFSVGNVDGTGTLDYGNIETVVINTYADGYTAAISTASDTVTEGEEISVTVTVSGGAYNAGEIALSYPNSIMSYKEYNTSSDEVTIDTNTAGKIYIVDKGSDNASGTTYTLTFTATTVGTGEVTLDSAAFGTRVESVTSDLNDATVSGSPIAVTVKAKTFSIVFPEDSVAGGYLFETAETPTQGTDLTFTATNNHYTYTNVVAKVGADANNATEVAITGDQANGWTIPGTSITGNIYVTATVNGVSYAVNYSYTDKDDQPQTGKDGDATYGTNYTYTMPDGVAISGATDGFHYEVDSVTVDDVPLSTELYTQNVSAKTVTIYGRAITGEVVITLKKVTDLANSWKVTVEADNSIATGEYSCNSTVEKGQQATLVIIPLTGYSYTVNAKTADDGAEVALTKNGNTYTTTAGVTEDIVFVIERTVTTDGVLFVTPFLEGGMGDSKNQNMYLVKMSTNLGTKHYTCNGKAMFWSDEYQANCYLVIASEAPTAAELTFTIAEGAAETITYDMDVNGSDIVDANDAQLAYDMYNKYYNIVNENVTIEKFLKADANHSGSLDVNDAVTIVNAILERMQ